MHRHTTRSCLIWLCLSALWLFTNRTDEIWYYVTRPFLLYSSKQKEVTRFAPLDIFSNSRLDNVSNNNTIIITIKITRAKLTWQRKEKRKQQIKIKVSHSLILRLFAWARNLICVHHRILANNPKICLEIRNFEILDYILIRL